MHSSISSSDAPRQRWMVAWMLALVVAAALAIATERLWRARGYRPNILDSAQLWSQQRDRAYATHKIPLLLLGASRIEYGIDMKLLKELLPRYQPVMLAQNGHYPLATLRDLAGDEHFRGVVLCDIDARGLSSYYRDAQQAYVDYYRKQWSPGWRVHRAVLTLWQRHALIAAPEFGPVAEIKRALWSPGWPFRSPVNFHADRSGDIDFDRVGDRTALTRNFVDDFKNDTHAHPPQPPETWRANLAPVADAVAAIRTRGGSVVFVQTPTSGELHELEAAAYPRALYWDRLGDTVGAATLSSDDIAAWQSFRLLDGSHVDGRDKPAYTRTLVDALLARGLLER